MPKPAGETAAGDPIFEIRSVRLVLRGEATSFNRLIPCSRCGRDVLGPAVLSPGDLDYAVQPVICKECVATATSDFGADRPAPVADEVDGITIVAAGVRDLGVRLDGMAEALARVDGRLDRLRDRLDEAADVESPPAPAGDDLARIELQLNDRLDRLAERTARAAGAGTGRLDALDARMAEIADRLDRIEAQQSRATESVTTALEAQRRHLESALRDALAEARDARPSESVPVERLDALELRQQQNADDMSELVELHAVLDVGLGSLRTQIAELRSAMSRVADDQGDIEDRLEAFVRGPLQPTQQAKGRKARKGEADARLTALVASTDDLAREHQQLEAQVADLRRATEAAAAATARAASQAAASSPTRTDVRALQEQVAAQDQALDGLRRAVERMRTRNTKPPSPTKAARPTAKG